MELPKFNLEVLRTVPATQKILLLVLIVAAIGGGFYNFVALPKYDLIEGLHQQIGKLDSEIQTTSIKVQHLDELIAASKHLEVELAKKRERLPPEEEAITLLKQLSDVAVRLGLDIKLWKPGMQVSDTSKLFLKMPVSVELAGGYHTAALFFDKINKLPRIINVSDLRMGSSQIQQDRVVIQTMFELTAFVAPPDSKPPASAVK